MKKNIINRRSVWTAIKTALVCLVLSTVPSFGQTITNPSFEANVFTVAPGSINANGPITGWTAADNTRAGLAPAGALNTFANNGVIPNGTNVLYVQTTNVVSTVISGLTPGSAYTVRFRANSQSGTTPTLRVSLDNLNLLDAGSVVSVGGVLPYQFVSLNFAATATSHTLNITNNATAVTAVLLLDDFSVALSTGGWSIAAWTNDASSGIDSSKNYSHAYAFGVTGTPVPVNGVNFTRIAGAGPQVAYELQTANLGSTTTDGGNVIRTAAGGTSSNLAFGFVFNGNPEIFNLQNLVPGAQYVATIYSVGWDPRVYGRAVTWTVGNDRLSVNEDQFGDGVGIRVSYAYTAPASGYLTISNFPFSTAVGTFHCFALANYEVNPQTTPLIGVQPANKVSIPGAGAGFYITAGGARPLSFRWMKGGTEIANQTNRTLILSNLAVGDLANYSVSVSNSFGVVTSAVASLTFNSSGIPNPSFEADTFFTFPGYSSVNFPIAGWISSNPGRTGLNPAADVIGPFANNGTIPDGRQAAFIQGTAANSLRTIISGLTSNTTYNVQFRANGRAGQAPSLHVGIDGQSVVDTRFNNVTGTNAYRPVSFYFAAANTNVTFSLTNDTTTDTTVAFDNFTITPATSQWSFVQWTNDATAGVDPSKLYTHAYHFGATVTDTNVSGVTFRGVSGINPAVAGFFSSAGFGSTFAGDLNVLTTNGGGSAGLAGNFIHGGPVQTITLTNLLPGNEYVASIYGVAFDVRAYGRAATFSVGSDLMTINLDHFGNDQGIVVSYRYFAPSNGSITLTYTPTDSASSFHTYAFANRVAADSVPVIGAQPISAFVAVGTTVNLSVGLSAGSLPLYYQWRLNGVNITDATNSTLAISNLNSYGTSGYTVVVTNFLGSATSVVASVEVGTALSDLWNTGVDGANVFLSGGQVDAHYQLVASADPLFPGPDARVMHNGAFLLAGNYFTNGLFSSWISPRTNSTPGNTNGLYVYRTSFIIDTADPAHAQINGKWASDNEGVAIILNGVPTGISNMVSAAFTGFYPFTIANGFLAGTNIIDFVISNGPATGPTGLRVEMNGVGAPLTNTPPQIVSQPASRTVAELSDVSFTVLASGSAPLTYQWYYFGFDLPNETNRTLRLTHVSQFDQAGDYDCIITNPFGQTNTVTATLTIIVPPIIDSVTPSSQTVECGGGATFSVVASGDGPLAYQWYFGPTLLGGQTNDLLTLTNVNAAQVGGYNVVVSNLGGSVTSSVVTLATVDTTPPTINIGQNETVQCGASWDFTVPILGDNCDNVGALTLAIVSTTTNADCGATMVATRIWKVTDTSANSTLATQVVTVVDFDPPTFTAFPADVTVGCLLLVPPPDVSAITGTDFCNPLPVLITFFGDVTNNTPPVTITRTYRARDDCGNVAFGSQVITLDNTNDTSAPVITFSFTNLTLAAGTNCTALMPDVTGTNYLLATDCSSLTYTQSIATNTVLASGTTVVVLAAVDAAGNAAYSTNYIVVADLTGPINDIGQAFGNGEVTLECGLGWGFTYPILTDNCDAPGSIALFIFSTATNFDCGHTFTATRVWLAVDTSGNSTLTTQIVHQVDNSVPYITNCPAALTVDCFAAVPAPDLTLVGAWDYCDDGFTVYPPLPLPTITHVGDVTNGFAPRVITRTYRATDVCGNFANCVQIITVADTNGPVIVTCATNQTLLADTNCQATLPDFTGQISATDCDGPIIVTQSPLPGTVVGLGTHLVTFTTTDAFTNVTTCAATITVEPALALVPLAIEQQGTNAVITWAAAAGNCWTLQQTTDLTLPILWAAVTNAVVPAGTNRTVTVEAGPGMRYFRLERP